MLALSGKRNAGVMRAGGLAQSLSRVHEKPDSFLPKVTLDAKAAGLVLLRCMPRIQECVFSWLLHGPLDLPKHCVGRCYAIIRPL